MSMLPTFDLEHQYWSAGLTHVAGIDEVGVGALAGPVVAGAVIFDSAAITSITPAVSIRDSKQLSAKQREAAAQWIHAHAISWAVGEATVAEITTLNIRRAAHLAMQRAVDQLELMPELLLIDGTPAQPHPRIPAVNLIDGDALCLSIAAASILAKVHRDARMVALDHAFPAYGFAGHKGYGSAKHLAALAEHGVSAHHRTTYAPVARLVQHSAQT